MGWMIVSFLLGAMIVMIMWIIALRCEIAEIDDKHYNECMDQEHIQVNDTIKIKWISCMPDIPHRDAQKLYKKYIKLRKKYNGK